MNNKKILVVDDDPAIVDVLKIMLEMEGYDVIASVHPNVIDQLLSQHPRLVLLDIWMSGCDGRDICRQLKSTERFRHIPVIMISASRDVVSSALASGADGFIAKPFDVDELLGVVGRHFSAVYTPTT